MAVIEQVTTLASGGKARGSFFCWRVIFVCRMAVCLRPCAVRRGIKYLLFYWEKYNLTAVI